MQDGLKLSRISLYSPFSNHKAQESASADSESAFQRVRFHVVFPKEIECLLEMCGVILALLGFHQHIINVFSASRGCMGIWWYLEKASRKDSIPCPVEASIIWSIRGRGKLSFGHASLRSM